MSAFEQVKVVLKYKWLDYYQINELWIKTLMDSPSRWVKTPDGGLRPTSEIILGAVSAVEPKLSEWIYPFCQLNPDTNKLIEILGLNFDPGIELEKRKVEETVKQNNSTISLIPDVDSEYLKKIRAETQGVS